MTITNIGRSYTDLHNMSKENGKSTDGKLENHYLIENRA